MLQTEAGVGLGPKRSGHQGVDAEPVGVRHFVPRRKQRAVELGGGDEEAVAGEVMLDEVATFRALCLAGADRQPDPFLEHAFLALEHLLISASVIAPAPVLLPLRIRHGVLLPVREGAALAVSVRGPPQTKKPAHAVHQHTWRTSPSETSCDTGAT